MNNVPHKETRFPEPSPIEWVKVSDRDIGEYWDVKINGICVASLEKRPHYCDRGHFWVKCFLRGLDEADMFPRYYMNEETAQQETKKFLRWRLWKQRS